MEDNKVGVTGNPFTGKVIIAGVEVNADSLERIQACVAACEGITTEALAAMPKPFGGLLSTSFSDVITQRDTLLSALESLLAKAHKQNFNDHYADVVAQSEAAIDQAKAGPTPHGWATGTADAGATNHMSFITKLLESATGDRFTSVSKGGIYERLGAIRGAGSFKGLAGIAYLDEKGNLYVREPECFTKRMVKAEGGAQ